MRVNPYRVFGVAGWNPAWAEPTMCNLWLKMKVLVADDIKQNRYLLQKLLEGHGYVVETASDGVEALEKARASPPDMVITDSLMPRMDGFQLCRTLKKDEELRSIPVLFHSATYTDKESRELALSIGAADYIKKPIEPDEFIKIVKETFDKYERGELKPAEKPLEEKVYMKLYNERLIQKLEKKMLALEKSEKRIEHLNSVLKAIRNVNQLIIVEKDRDSLLQKACDVLIEARGYDAAWLGFLSDGETFAMVKGSGFREDFSRFREHLLGGEPPPCFKNALAQKVPFMLVDKSIQCGDCFFKNAHTDKEVAIIRVEHAGKLFGLLAISLASDVAADEEEKGILKEVAGDIGFALHDMEMDEARKRAEESLRESEERKELALRGADLATWDWNTQTGECIHDKRWAEMFGYTLDELEQHVRTWENMVHPDDMPLVNEALNAHVEGKTPFYETEHRCRHKSGEWIWILDKGKVIEWDSNGKALRAAGTLLDITERKRAENKIKASLKEKEVLLREIHHRVKNNLQVVSSMLNMQVRKATEKNVIKSLLDTRSRIQTMSLIHAQLYQSENFEQVEMGTTIRKMVSSMLQIYAEAKKNITSAVTAEGVILPISHAIPCGLIINELVSNALKHAFKGMTEGSVEISMRELAGDKIKLTVKDNGVGIPEEMDIYKTDTIGLKIVRTLAEEQLKGKMGLIQNKGTEIYVEFDKSITNGK